MTIVYVLKHFVVWHHYFPQGYAVHVFCQGSKNGHRIKSVPASFTSETQLNARMCTAKTGREAVIEYINVYRGNLEDREKYGRLKKGS